MTNPDPEIIRSKLSRSFTWDGHTVQVEIYRLADRPGWALEVISAGGVSTVWEDTFDSERDADDIFREVIAKEGIEAFLDDEGQPASSSLH